MSNIKKEVFFNTSFLLPKFKDFFTAPGVDLT